MLIPATQAARELVFVCNYIICYWPICCTGAGMRYAKWIYYCLVHKFSDASNLRILTVPSHNLTFCCTYKVFKTASISLNVMLSRKSQDKIGFSSVSATIIRKFYGNIKMQYKVKPENC